MKYLTYQNYLELSNLLIKLEELNKELTKHWKLNYVKVEIKLIALELDFIFMYENRVISGNIAYSISRTINLESCLRSQIKRLRTYIIQGIINSDSYTGLYYIKLLYVQNLYIKTSCINNKE